MNNKITVQKPIQASDYGKDISRAPKNNDKNENTNTDGRKTLALWYR